METRNMRKIPGLAKQLKQEGYSVTIIEPGKGQSNSSTAYTGHNEEVRQFVESLRHAGYSVTKK